MSNLGPKKAANFYPVTYTISLPKVKTIDKILINWKFKPKVFDILL